MTTQSRSCTQPSAGAPPAGFPSESIILGRAAGENFQVASRLLPSRLREQLMALYGYARLIDYLGDEFDGDRPAALDWAEAHLRSSLGGAQGDQTGAPALIDAMAALTIQTGIDPAPLFDLIEANRRDQQRRTYETYDELVDYCRLSADPVGRLVLSLFGFADEKRTAWSDSICTGLQLAEHWQDVAEDAGAGRVYLPGEDLDRFGLPRSAGELRTVLDTSAMRALMVFEVARARRLLIAGTPLAPSLPFTYRLTVAGFRAGGLAALDGIAARDFDVSRPPSRPAATRVLHHVVGGWA